MSNIDVNFVDNGDNADLWQKKPEKDIDAITLGTLLPELPAILARIEDLRSICEAEDVSKTQVLDLAIAKIKNSSEQELSPSLQERLERLADKTNFSAGGVSYGSPESILDYAIAKIDAGLLGKDEISLLGDLSAALKLNNPTVLDVLKAGLIYIEDGHFPPENSAKLQELARAIELEEGDFNALIDTAIAKIKAIPLPGSSGWGAVARAIVEKGIDPTNLLKTVLLEIIGGREIHQGTRVLACLVSTLSYHAGVLQIKEGGKDAFEIGLTALANVDNARGLNQISTQLLKLLPTYKLKEEKKID